MSTTPPGPLDERELERHRCLLAGRELPLGRPDLPARQPAAARAAARRARQAAAARPLGHDPGPELRLRAPQPRDPGARPRRDLRRRPGPRRPGRWSRNTYLEGTYTEVYPHIGRDEEGLRRLFRQFSFPGGIPQPRRAGDARARSTRAASSATRSRTPTARRSTTRICWSCCVVGDGEAETGPLAASWHSNKFLEPGARRRGAADPAPQRLQDRQPDGAGAHPARGAARRCSRATATRRCFVEGDDPARDAPARWRRRSTRCVDEIAEHPARGAPAVASAARPRWPMIVLRTPEGLDRPEGGRRPAGRGLVALAPGAARRASRRTPSTSRSSRSGCAATGPRSSSTRAARCAPELRGAGTAGRAAHGRQPARQRRPAAARTSSCRTSATTRSTCRRPGAARRRGDPRARRASCAT